ncbi:MAG: ParA family protein [Anaerolineae bacterium]|nr:ParA family protein [Anaerolineae bacterium]
MTKVIAVASNKGGVGKTTTCLSLGGGLAEQNQFTLLVDLDPQAHLSLSLGVKPETARYTAVDVLTGQKSLVAASQETTVNGLDLVPASRELVVVDKLLYQRPGYEYRLKEDLSRQPRALHDVILIDCPPTFGTATLNALTAADLLIIPVQCEFYAVRSLQQMLDMVTAVRKKTNPTLSYRLLVTMFDKRNKVHTLLLEQMQQRFRGAMFDALIQIDTRLRESPVFELPITHHAPSARAAHQYRALTQELIDLLYPVASYAAQPAPSRKLVELSEQRP